MAISAAPLSIGGVSRNTSLRRLSGAFLLAGACSTPSLAQDCGAGHWISAGGVAGVNGRVWAVAEWDPDGPGGSAPVLVVGGKFDVAGDQRAAHIAIWDGIAWSALSEGLNGDVLSLCGIPGGDLIVGGSFTQAGNASAVGIARWDGSEWSALDSGPNFPWVAALALAPNGTLVVGGIFSAVGAIEAANIARWDGTAWSAIGQGFDLPVNALAVQPDGRIVAGGHFTTTGDGRVVNHIARWNGESWRALGSGMAGTDTRVDEIVIMPNGDIVAGGHFEMAGGVPARSVARWNGSGWSALSGFNVDVAALAVRPNGELLAGLGGVTGQGVWRRSGTSWINIGPGTDRGVFSLLVRESGELVAGGDFDDDGDGISHVARWNASSWGPMAAALGFDDVVYDVAVTPEGAILAAGDFGAVGGADVSRIASWDGTAWHALGGGIGNHATDYVHRIAVLPDGDVVAAGRFTRAGGVSVRNVARWNGQSWAPMGTSNFINTEALHVLPDGRIAIARMYLGDPPLPYLAAWSGVAWEPVGPSVPGAVADIATLPSGDVIIGGEFVFEGGRAAGVLRLQGDQWVGFGVGPDHAVADLVVLPGGDLLAAGRSLDDVSWYSGAFTVWRDNRWEVFAPPVAGFLQGVELLPDGSLVAALRSSTLEGSASRFMRWDGASWSEFAGTTNGPVFSLVVSPTELVIGGEFTAAGTVGSSRLARFTFARDTCDGDTNANGTVDFDDLSLVLGNFGTNSATMPGISLPGDADCSSTVDFTDLNIVLGNFGATCR